MLKRNVITWSSEPDGTPLLSLQPGGHDMAILPFRVTREQVLQLRSALEEAVILLDPAPPPEKPGT